MSANSSRMVAWLARLCLERDDFSSNRHPALSLCLSMIFSENRYPLFRIMLHASHHHSRVDEALLPRRHFGKQSSTFLLLCATCIASALPPDTVARASSHFAS